MTTQNRSAIRSTIQTRPYDWGLISIVTALLLLGAVMVFSASFAQGIYGFGDPYYFISKQLIWTVVGVIAMIVAAMIPYPVWQRWSVPIMGITLLSLIAVIFLGDDTFGSTRTFFGGRVQPSEPAKIAIIIYISTWLASKGSSIRNVKVGLAPFAVLLGIITLLLISQPDISTAILIVATAFLMFFIAGAEIRQLVIIGAGGTTTFWLIIHYSSYARDRVELFLESFSNPILSTEWQVEQAIRAFVRGGVFGVGLGNAEAKLPGHLPVSWSDNIYAVIGEELGLIGAVFVMILFGLLAYRGIRTALLAPDNFGALLATGITALLILQALLNMAVAVAISPPTGVTLPFISYGGSSLVTVLAGIGILISIGRAHQKFGAEELLRGRPTNARIDFGRRNRGTRLPGTGSSESTVSAESAS